MTVAHYIALLRKESDTDYGVSFPDLPGCVTAGRSLEEARTAAAEALAFHLEGLADDKAEIPAPSSLDDIMGDSDNRDGVGVLVAAPRPSRAVRVNVTLPSDLLAAIDETAGPGNRSAFLAKAAAAKLTGNVKVRRSPKVLAKKKKAKAIKRQTKRIA